MRLKKRYPVLLFLGVLFAVMYKFHGAFLFGYGYNQMYSGNDEFGNKLMKYAISRKIETANYKAYHQLSVRNTKNGNFDIAYKALKIAYSKNQIEMAPYFAWVLLYYYHSYEESYEILEFLDDSTPGFRDYPMGESVNYLKGLALYKMGRFNDAIIEFDIYIDEVVCKSSEEWLNVYVFVNKANCLFEQQKYQEAIQNYKRAIKNYKECTEAYYFMGLAQNEINQLDSACLSFNKSLELLESNYKSSDTYVELFHEIYPSQICEKILELCK